MSDELSRLRHAGDALAWALDRLDALVDARNPASVLELLVGEARVLTGAPGVWALTWTGDLCRGRASFRDLAGGGVEGVPAPLEISRTIVGTAVREGRPVWTDDAASDARFQNRESITSLALRSVGCVPVGPKGVLYLLDPNEPGRFSREDRLRLAALCHIAGSFLREPGSTSAPRTASSEPLPGMVGSEGTMSEVVDAVRAFAPCPWPALILGETGTGKELIAKAMHALSPRASGHFVPVNCGAISEGVAETELFGVKKGGHSTAFEDREGYVGEAGGGTLFLDEIGELSAPLQVKLLRLVENSTYNRVGDPKTRRFEGRILAASNRDLDNPDGRGDFREDLFYRLASAVVRLPPLRERRADIPDLAEHLLERLIEEYEGAPAMHLSEEVRAELRRRDWPGNVRELENSLRGAISRCVISDDTVIRPEHLAGERRVILPEDETGVDIGEAVDRFVRRKVHEALEAEGGNRTRAGQRLGRTRQWVQKKLAQWREHDGEE